MQKSIATILLAVTFLGSMMDLHDLARLPRLIEHYKEHASKSPDVSFIDFLNLHYGSEAERHDKEEHQEHTSLPFKNPDCTYTHTLTVVPQFNAPEIAQVVSVVTYSNFYQSAFSSEFSQSIWQPPKKA